MNALRSDVMATIRQRRPGVWEVRGYTGKDVDGKSTQVSRTVYGTKKDAKLVAAELTVKPARNAGGRKLRQLLDEWIDIKTPGWADLTIRDQTSRAKQVAADPIGNMSVASIGVSDVDRWVARLRKAGVGEGAIRNQHTVLRSALQQAVRWEWIATNPASSAPIESPKRQQQRTLTNDEVRAVITAAPRSTSSRRWRSASAPRWVPAEASWPRCAGTSSSATRSWSTVRSSCPPMPRACERRGSSRRRPAAVES